MYLKNLIKKNPTFLYSWSILTNCSCNRTICCWMKQCASANWVYTAVSSGNLPKSSLYLCFFIFLPFCSNTFTNVSCGSWNMASSYCSLTTYLGWDCFFYVRGCFRVGYVQFQHTHFRCSFNTHFRYSFNTHFRYSFRVGYNFNTHIPGAVSTHISGTVSTHTFQQRSFNTHISGAVSTHFRYSFNTHISTTQLQHTHFNNRVSTQNISNNKLQHKTFQLPTTNYKY